MKILHRDESSIVLIDLVCKYDSTTSFIKNAFKLVTKNTNELVILKSKNGKPYISNCNDYKFNISHKNEYIVIIISAFEVGIDIESLEKDFDSSFYRYFSDKENEIISKSRDIKKQTYLIWTKKEAYVKCTGNGLLDILNNICTVSIEGIDSIFYKNYIISFFCDCQVLNKTNSVFR
ncbi:MAG: 4'-phosphopantetheinyl transferase superfamily protein [Bacillota bacterium]